MLCLCEHISRHTIQSVGMTLDKVCIYYKINNRDSRCMQKNVGIVLVEYECMYSGTSRYGHLTSKVTSPLLSPEIVLAEYECMYSGTSRYGHLTSKVTSPLLSPEIVFLSAENRMLTPSNMVTSPMRSFLLSPLGDRNSEVPQYTRLFSRGLIKCSQ